MTVVVLVVEDNPDNSKLVTWILEDEGYEVVCAATAEEGIALMEKQRFTLLTLTVVPRCSR